VLLLGRARLQAALREVGQLTVLPSSYHPIHIPFDQLNYQTEGSALVEFNPDYLVVTLKGIVTQSALEELKEYIPPHTVVISLQNGIHNADVIQSILPNKVVRGMFPFNVVTLENGQYKQGSAGKIHVGSSSEVEAFVEVMNSSHIPTIPHGNMLGVMYGKLVLNLNNSLNALSGLTLKQELDQYAFRSLLSDLQQEALDVYKAAGIEPVATNAVPVWTIPKVLHLPDFIVQPFGTLLFGIDPVGRSSMYEDLVNGRLTEVDLIHGEVVGLATKHGVQAPLNAGIVRVVKEWEQHRHNRSPGWSADEIRRRLL
jgi:2-dehydropantoate 2-reductase